MNYEISGEDAQSILNYLVQRPWSEVHLLVASLQVIQPVKEPEE